MRGVMYTGMNLRAITAIKVEAKKKMAIYLAIFIIFLTSKLEIIFI